MFQEVNRQLSDFSFRFLEKEDYHRGLFDTLGQLTKAPQPTYEDFQAHLEKMRRSSQEHLNIVGIDKKTGKVIAFGTVLICQGPFGRTGKIENIVTCKSVRGKGLGKTVIELLKWLGWQYKCVRVTLFCEQKNVQFYHKLGFTAEGTIYASYRQ